MKTHVFSISSTLPGLTHAVVWQHIVDWRQINRELWPMAMSHPARFPTVAAVPADGHSHFTSTLSYRNVPFDRHRFALRELEEGRWFDESSSNLLLRRWTHRRSLEESDRGIVVTDACTLTARLPLVGSLAAAVYRRVFQRRHRRLRECFARPDQKISSGESSKRSISS